VNVASDGQKGCRVTRPFAPQDRLDSACPAATRAPRPVRVGATYRRIGLASANKGTRGVGVEYSSVRAALELFLGGCVSLVPEDIGGTLAGT